MQIKYVIRVTWNINTKSSQDFLTDSKNGYKVFKFDTKQEAKKYMKEHCNHFKNKLFEVIQVYFNQ